MVRAWVLCACVLLIPVAMATAGDSSRDKPSPAVVASGDKPSPAVVASGDKPSPAGVASGDEPSPAGVVSGDKPSPAGVASGDEPSPAGVASGDKASQAGEVSKDGQPEAKELSGMSIVGNDEAPKSLYIVPWKSSEIGAETRLNTMLNEGDVPVDRDVFRRQVEFYRISTGK